MSWSDVANVLEAGVNLVGTFQANRQARDARNAQGEAVDAELDRVRYVQDQYSEGGDKLAAMFQQILADYGQFGQVSPDYITEMTRYFGDNRAAEQRANTSMVDGMSADDIARFRELESVNRLLAEGRISTNEAGNRATAEGRVRDYESGFRGLAAQLIAEGTSGARSIDEAARASAPDVLDFAPLQDMLTARFAALRGANTGREIDNQYAKAMASVPQGMENSTLRVQLERAMGDLAAERRNQDLLAAVGDAQRYIDGLLGASGQDQQMELRERQMMQSLADSGIARSGVTLQQYLAGGEYGAGLGGAINEAGFRGGEYGIGLGDALNRSGFAGGQYGSGLATEENAMRGRAISEFAALRSLPSNTAYADFLTGLNSVGAESELASQFLSQMSDVVRSPYTFRATGSSNATFGTALDALRRRSDSASEIAAGNMAGLGDWWTSFRDNENF